MKIGRARCVQHPPALTTTRKDRTMAYRKHRPTYHEGKRLCYKCDIYFAVGAFNKESRNKDGLRNECRVCDAARNKARYDAMTDDEYQRRVADNKRFRQTNVRRSMMIHMLNSMKQRCKKSGKTTELDRTHIEAKFETGICEATGIRFRYERNGRGSIAPFSPSLDCIEPEGDYTRANTQTVCSMYNIGKARHNELDFIAMCIAVANRNRDNIAAQIRYAELIQ